MLLPRKVGPFTLMRKLSADALAETFVAILDAPAGKQVVVRRLLPVVARDRARVESIRARVGDLRSVRAHPCLVPVVGLEQIDGDVYVVEEQAEGVELGALVAHSSSLGQPIPHNVYLHLATQLCNALEALHSRPGIETGSEHVLHLAVTPAHVWVTGDGRVTLGRYGLARSPAMGTGATGTLPADIEYLSPEQTHQDQKLLPASDLFSLGTVLYELLTFKPMFRAETNLQTIHRVRRAEVTTQLLEVKEILPGLDKVLFRSLSLNPRHRYQRAFVLREDLRGLMAGFSFSDIDAATRAFLEPTIASIPAAVAGMDSSALGREFHEPRSNAAKENTAALLRGVPDRDGDLSESPLNEPRAFTPPPGMRSAGPEDFDEPRRDRTQAALERSQDTGTLLADDTDALLGGDTSGTWSKPAAEANRPEAVEQRPAGESTAWTPNAKKALAALAPDPPSRPLQDIDTSRRSRSDLLDAPEVRKLEGSPGPSDTDFWDRQEHTGRGDTLPMQLETTFPSADDDQDSGRWPRVPMRGPPSLAPEPPPRQPGPAATGLPGRTADLPTLEPDDSHELRSRDLPRSAELRSADLEQLPSDFGSPRGDGPPTLEPDDSAGFAPPADFASSLAEDTGLNPVRRTPPPPPPPRPMDLRPEVPSPVPAPARPAARAHEPPVPARNVPDPLVSEPAWDEEPPAREGRSLAMPLIAAAVVASLTALAVFTCVGGGGVVGFLGLRGTNRSTEVAALQPEPTRAAPSAAPAPPTPAPVEAAPIAAVAPTPPPLAPAPTPRQRELNLDLSPPKSAPARETFEAVAALEPPPRPRPEPRPPPPPPPAPQRPAPVPTPVPVAAPPPLPEPDPVAMVEEPAAPVGDPALLDAWSQDAFGGQLGPEAKARLGELPPTDPLYLRAHTLLFLDAKARGDARARDAALATLMAIPESQYNPALLVERAQIGIERREWSQALRDAKVAEQHWARLPSELVFSRKAMMYELQALAHTGMFYDSEGEDLALLEAAIRDWERYERHVQTKDRADLAARADESLARLTEIRRRLEATP